MTTKDPALPLSQNPDDFCVFDTETRAIVPGDAGNVKIAGAYRYSQNAKVVILTYAIGHGPVKEWVLEDFSETLRWIDAPPDLLKFLSRALKGDAWFIALNAAFDREVCNYGITAPTDKDTLPIETVIDVACQLQANGMPGGLEQAARIIGHAQKDKDGKRLIDLFSSYDGETPQSRPEDWAKFRAYAVQDVEATRDLFYQTRQLTAGEWQEYWAAEKVNARGLPIDREFAAKAAALAEVYRANARAEIARITGNDWGPHHHGALASWAYDKLAPTQPALCELMVKTYITDENDPDGESYTVGKIGLDREKIEKVIARLETVDANEGLTDDEAAVLEMCEVKLYGAGASVMKFGKALDTVEEDGRSRGQYVFNGAGQTGRFSSKGWQAHNMTRSWLGMEQGDTGMEGDAIEFILDLPDEVTLDHLSQFEKRFGNAGRALSRLIRPMIAPPDPDDGKIVSVDKSQIEARVLPWLANAEERLNIFREVDADPSLPDLYKRTAAATYGVPVEKIDKAQRQIGKVQELALGFAGGKGALISMASLYRLALSDTEAQKLVDIWRENNQWAVDFWADVWEAFTRAFDAPGTARTAGKLTYLYDPDYLGGTMYCILPGGRIISYVSLRYSEVTKTDKFGNEETKVALTYLSGGTRRTLWKGTLVENATQAVAASLLRARILACENKLPGVLVGHTHDELIALCTDDEAEWIAEEVKAIMESDLRWSAGLPQKAEPEIQNWYSKVEE